MIKEDCIFAAIARQCTMNPLRKKKGIPQRNYQLLSPITNYRLLIDPLIKTSRDWTEESLTLQQVLGFVKVSFSLYFLKKEMDNEVTIVFFIRSRRTFSSQEIKKEIGSFIQQRLVFECGGQTFVFCLHWVTD